MNNQSEIIPAHDIVRVIFVFQLAAEEVAALRSQTVISKGRGGRRYLKEDEVPYRVKISLSSP